jgi:hypothetical protein
MSQIYCRRCKFLVPMRWLRPGGDLSRPDHADQCVDCLSMHSKAIRRGPLHAPELACVQTCRSRRASVAPTCEVGANIKSP